MYYDFHIHSALSPCSDDTMTINNIFHMAYIKGLDMIAITDHNSLKQQHYLEDIIQSDILKDHIDFVHGVELQSQENIHILAYFQRGTNLIPIQKWIDSHLIVIANKPDYYGNQYICDASDQIIDNEDRLLITSLDIGVKEIIEAIHSFCGIAILAHVMSKKYGIYGLMHHIDNELDYDGIEVTCLKEYKELKELCPTINDEYVFINSDAHQLEDIQEAIYQMDKEDFDLLWRKRQCKKSQ